MTTAAPAHSAHYGAPPDVRRGPLASLGHAAHSHRWFVIAAWAIFAVALGIFAPRLEHALSGAMWEVNGSESLEARDIIDEQFGGLSSQSLVVVVQAANGDVQSPAAQEAIAWLRRSA